MSVIQHSQGHMLEASLSYIHSEFQANLGYKTLP